MISHLTGQVAAVGATFVVLDLNGFGMKALCTPGTAAAVRLGAATTLYTSLVVREDSLTLYGFQEAEERDLFELVQSASGIGPKIAQAVVSVMSPDDFRAAIASENLAALTRVPGIGRKGAEKMVIELRDKVNSLGAVTTPTPSGDGAAQWREQVADGLQGLGWSAKDAEAACDNVAHLVEADPAVGIAVLMRAALASLARK
ncbi:MULTISPECIES: Holliday junction branch migration protein RuvA [unclassified Luteococcus]|uniref:Holliday junction branch migration protein RuvA n=1 Tax=unclassified Luteococcus TaxID=2639923 RepID=UPI00313F0ED4